MALPRPQLEWVLFVESLSGAAARCPRPSPGPRGRSVPSWACPGPEAGPCRPCGSFRDPVPPFRFVDRVVREERPAGAGDSLPPGGRAHDGGFRRRRRRGPRAVARPGPSRLGPSLQAGAGGRSRRARTGLPARLPAPRDDPGGARGRPARRRRRREHRLLRARRSEGPSRRPIAAPPGMADHRGRDLGARSRGRHLSLPSTTSAAASSE